MKTLTLPVGLPRSGKSTWSRAQGVPIVNPDAIRMVLHGTAFRAEAESMVWAIAHTMVEALFEAGHDRVILDACSVSSRRRDEWRSKKWRTEYVLFRTSPEVCKERARANGQDYLLAVIDRMNKELTWPTENVREIIK